MTLDRVLLALGDWLAVSVLLVVLVALVGATGQYLSRPRRPRFSSLDSVPPGRAIAIEEYRRRAASAGRRGGAA